MIINRPGAEFIYDGASYKIGDRIIGTAESEYEGLYGSIFEIRDGEDKETENETPDIYCSFEEPILPHQIKKLETLFSELYREPKKLEDITVVINGAGAAGTAIGELLLKLGVKNLIMCDRFGAIFEVKICSRQI